jgi:deaminated glutathione amidase
MSTIALVQFRASVHKRDNLKLAIDYIHEAKRKRASLAAFPEFLMAYSPENQTAEELSQIAEGVDGEFASALRQAAKANNLTLVATIYEKSKLPNRVYDTACLIDPQGQPASVYRKLHLYDALGFQESAKLVSGDDLAKPVQTAIGNVGMMICYDLRFPEMARILALMGAEILISPSAWVEGEMKLEHWRTMIRARAIENGCYVIAPNQVGNIYIGHSMVVDPFGKIVLDMEQKEGLEVVELDPARTREVREKLPLLSHRRRDVYSKHLTASREPNESGTRNRVKPDN